MLGDDGVFVAFGQEVDEPSLHDCALVATRYGTGRGGDSAPLGTLDDVLLSSVRPPDNFLDLNRRVSRPFMVGDRVSSGSRMIPTSRLFGAYILLFVPGTEGSINVWDGGFVTYDPLSELEPQSFIPP